VIAEIAFCWYSPMSRRAISEVVDSSMASRIAPSPTGISPMMPTIAKERIPSATVTSMRLNPRLLPAEYGWIADLISL
jgi:hypothetical protein